MPAPISNDPSRSRHIDVKIRGMRARLQLSPKELSNEGTDREQALRRHRRLVRRRRLGGDGRPCRCRA
ncbi:hypothetical protein MPLDJ20_60731 [Mesorhizobium plurifarium]|uniref:Uncharacterized protein n=1 Tax=Mesorhizobium plurifarium TaxID=69974 RepID=A0A090FLP3_MESPL|nr:hypothetical protein MPLDJ20_60731 [Mesorhizobium plurifarium]